MVGVAVLGRDLPDVGLAEDVGELAGGEGVDLVVGCRGDELADAREVEFFLGVLREDIGADGAEAFEAGRGDFFVFGVEEENTVAVILESLGNLADPLIGAGEEDAGGIL